MKKAGLHHLTIQIVIALIAGIIVGLAIKLLPDIKIINDYLVNGLFDIIGKLFTEAMRMLVVPIVFVSLVCGVFSLNSAKKLGRLAGKTILLYLFTTALAITLGLLFAQLFHIGSSASLASTQYHPNIVAPQSLKTFLSQLIPANPLSAMVSGNMIQVIVFSLLIGTAISLSGEKGKPLATLFQSANDVLMRLIHLIMSFAPIGVFCLITHVFARMGFSVITELLGYFFTVVFVLIIQGIVTYSLLLFIFTRLNPITFYKNLYALMVFAFSTSSSNATLPITLETAEEKLGVDGSIAAFTVPLGATINMDGTAIMQGIATVFIANIYHIPLDFHQYLMVILTATLASIGTAGVPGVGLIMLAMVLRQVGLPVEGVALILGVDRLLDMLRTVVNVTGDSMVAVIVGKSEGAFSKDVFLGKSASKRQQRDA